MRLLKLTEERPDAAIRKAVTEAIAKATEKFKPLKYAGVYPTEGFGIATLRPSDLCWDGSTLTGTAQSPYYWCFSLAAASTWYDLINITLSEDLYVVITGFHCRMADPSISEIKPVVGGVEYPIEEIEEMYTWDEAYAYFVEPLVVAPSEAFKLRAIGKGASTKEYFGLMGFVIAKRPYLIKEV